MDLLTALSADWDALAPSSPSPRALLEPLDASERQLPRSKPRTRILPATARSPPPPPPSLPPPQRKRRRPQDEIDALRLQVYELSARADALRLGREPSARWQLLPEARRSLRAAAAEQLEARRRAERENAQLRAMARRSAAAAAHMREAAGRLLAAAARPDSLAPSCGNGGGDWRRAPEFADLVTGLDALYLATDAVLAPLQRMPAQQPLRQLERRADGEEDAPLVALVESRALPFELRVVDRALWRALLGQSTRVYPNFRREVAQEIGSDTMVTAARLGVRRGDRDLDICIRVASRRYVEPERVVVVSRALVEPAAAGSGASVGVAYRESRTRVLKRAGGSAAAVATVMQSHLAVYRESAAEPPADGWRDGQDAAFAAHGWRHALHALNQAVENLALDEAAGWSP